MNVWRATSTPGGPPLGLLLLLLLLFSWGELFVGADNLALLSGTLRTYQRAGCDDNIVTLRCPPGTSISIELAQYGSSGPSKALCGGGSSSSTEATDAAPKTGANDNISCMLSNAMQTKWDEVAQGTTWGRYSLLQTVVETCQKKPQCKFQTSPKTFGGDPCPGVRKYVEVAYKCRPYEFRSKIACENEKIQLKCNPNSRVAVYSASYGRTEYESIQCPQAQGVAEETCLVSYATETVMQLCHGKRSCELSADATTFGNPCQPKSRMYLKVVYTCVPRKVLKDQYEGRLEPDELQSEFNAYDDDFDYEHYDTAGNEFIRESAASPPASSANDRNEASGATGGSGTNNLTKDTSVTSAKLPPHTKSREEDKAPLSIPMSRTSTPTPTLIMPSSTVRSRRPTHAHSHRPHHHQRNRNHLSSTIPPRSRYYHCCMTYPYPYASLGPSDHWPAPTAPMDLSSTVPSKPPDLDPELNCTIPTVTQRSVVVGFISNWINTYIYLSQNRERFYLYLTLSVGSGVLLCLIILVIRLLIQRHRDKRDAKFHVTNITDTTIPNGFADDISEVDADIDLTTPLPVPTNMSTIAIHSPGTITGGTLRAATYPHPHPHHMLHQHPMRSTLMPQTHSQQHEPPRALAANTQYYYG